MPFTVRFDFKQAAALWRAGLAYAEGDGRGLAASLALHGLIALAVLLYLLRAASHAPVPPPRIVPVEVIRLGPETTSPPQPVKAKIPQPVTRRAPPRPAASANAPVPASPTATRPVPDDLETRLRNLAHLHQPESNTKPLIAPGAADTPATSDDATPGSEAAYAVRDLIRAQVERKWNFDVATLGSASFTVGLRITVLKNGTVSKVEVLDRERYTKDVRYHEIALSARNAVLQSSPLTLPPGAIDYSTDVTLSLNPRDALR